MHVVLPTSWLGRNRRVPRLAGPWIRHLAAAVAAAYGLACVGLYAAQRHLVFEPDATLHTTPADYPFPVRDVSIAASGEPGLTLHGWWLPASDPHATVVLYLHGNDGNVSTNMAHVAPLRRLGYSVFMIDYRGYGESGGGFPSERGVYRDAQSAWDYLVMRRGVDPANLIIDGHSLGGAVAIELALRHPEAAGLIVESSFTSIYDLTEQDGRYALFPVRLFLNQRFDSIDRVGRLRLPVLYIHGTDDRIVPLGMAEALYRATPSARGLIEVPAAGHENVGAAGGEKLRAAIARFVEDATQNRPDTPTSPSP